MMIRSISGTAVFNFLCIITNMLQHILNSNCLIFSVLKKLLGKAFYENENCIFPVFVLLKIEICSKICIWL